MLIKKFGEKIPTSLHFFILQEAKQKKLNSKIGNEKIIVDFAMRYGNPSINLNLIFLKI